MGQVVADTNLFYFILKKFKNNYYRQDKLSMKQCLK